MSFVHVIGTGGTIASRAETGGAVVADSTEQVLESTTLGTEITTEDVLQINSFHLTFADLVAIQQAVVAAIHTPDVDGVVITHGTDTMEETAFFLSLLHDSPKPVVVTGAQRAADQADTDGPENLRQAVIAAGSEHMRDAGVVIGFDAEFHAARHTRKRHTLATSTFSGGTLVAQFYHDELTRLATPAPYPILDIPGPNFAQLDIPVIDAAPGSGAELFHAALEYGAHGIVLQGVGAGNAPPTFTKAVETAVEAGVPVVLSTRVPSGPVAPIYGNGGAVTLLAAGALSANQLNTYQARILLAVLLSQQLPEDTLRAVFAAQTG
ncbi:asparaginase [Yaniella flava]|uniref:asparaginase n=1 Tax=Yaniella flava TaxID=287930 RepID=A0ABN2UY96_9MICC